MLGGLDAVTEKAFGEEALSVPLVTVTVRGPGAAFAAIVSVAVI
jgi:hypothetical protein